MDKHIRIRPAGERANKPMLHVERYTENSGEVFLITEEDQFVRASYSPHGMHVTSKPASAMSSVEWQIIQEEKRDLAALNQAAESLKKITTQIQNA